MIRGIGVDVAKVERFAGIAPEHVLSPAELLTYQSFGIAARKHEFLAGRFAVKEAIIKASPTGLSVKSMPLIEIANDVNGRPYLASGQFPLLRVWLSISHEADVAVGLCVLESD
ncbi:MAG: holo-ACP synthase [Bacillota bacterium]|nr:holo-ACP synthase [Bacillota bacterium]